MTEPTQAEVPIFIAFSVFLLLSAWVVSWGVIAGRLVRKQPLVPSVARRPVPWNGADVLLIVFTYLFVAAAMVQVARFFFAVDVPLPVSGRVPDNAHPVLRVLGEGLSSGTAWAVALAALSVVVVAPLFEEFFFRIIVQGWFESVDTRHRAPFVPFGLFPILLTSLFFALLHVRIGERDEGLEEGILVLAAHMISSGLVMVFAVAYLRVVRGATVADFGWRKDAFLADLQLGIATACAVLGPLYVIQFVFQRILPEAVAPDPFPIFVLSAVLGFLYLRTHRVLPGIVLHACLNALSLAMAILAFQLG